MHQKRNTTYTHSKNKKGGKMQHKKINYMAARVTELESNISVISISPDETNLVLFANDRLKRESTRESNVKNHSKSSV